MRVDLHVHTRESSSTPHHWLGEFLGVHECYTHAEEALDVAIHRGMDAIAITNHDTAEDAIRMAAARPDRVIPGCEYTVYAGGGKYVHVVVLGVSASSHGLLARERRRGLGRFTSLARSEGLPFFLAHPAWDVTRDKSGIRPSALCDWMEHFDILESLNGNCLPENVIARGLARYYRKTEVGGSDSHGVASVGSAWTQAEADGEVNTVGEFMECMREGRVRPARPPTGSVPPPAEAFAAMTREVVGTFYRRELLKAVGSGSLERYMEQASGSQLVKAVVEFLLLPGFFWMPQAGSKTYLAGLAGKADRLKRGLVDLLTHKLARRLAREDLAAEERARRWIGGMRDVYFAFEQERPDGRP